MLSAYTHTLSLSSIFTVKNSMDVERRVKSTLTTLLLFLLLVIHVDFGNCFSLFRIGDSPQQYFLGDPLLVKVDKLTSADAVLPYAYYSIPFCHPDAMFDTAGYFGDFLENQLKDSAYLFKMLEPLMCTVVCRMTLDAQSAKSFQEKIHENYQFNMFLDRLPVAVRHQLPSEEADYNYQIGSNQLPSEEADYNYQIGFNVGLKGQYAGEEDYQYFIYNHLAFTVMYHKDARTDSANIVGFMVNPLSVKYDEGKWNETTTLTTCKTHIEETYFSSVPQIVRDKEDIVFTYDVIFQESNVTWESRWNAYHQTQADELHFYAAINHLVTLAFYLGVLAIIMMRTYRDISKYNEPDMLEETGWKLVHGDVFRRPINSDLLCIFAGTGVQCFGTMITAMMILSVSGFILPSDWDEFWRVILVLWALMGYFAGYSSAQLYKMFGGTQWRKTAAKTAFMLPGPVAIILFILNFLYSQKSSYPLPFPSGQMFALILLWFGFSIPLVFIGSFFGFRTQAIQDPVITNKIPREIPEQPYYRKPIISLLAGGILPFGVVFYELWNILVSIWLHQLYYIQSFQFLAFLTLLATCAGTTIVLCYFQLCREDYRWWWTSFLTSGLSGVYLFLYATYFFACMYVTKPVAVLLYFGYMLIGSFAFFVLTGTVGFYACLCFTRYMYSSLKID